jgi:hypothetical protein
MPLLDDTDDKPESKSSTDILKAILDCCSLWFKLSGSAAPKNAARLQNKTSDRVTFKCYRENDNLNLVPQTEATLGEYETHDFIFSETDEKKFKVYVSRPGSTVGTYHAIVKGKSFQWDGSCLSEAWV